MVVRKNMLGRPIDADADRVAAENAAFWKQVRKDDGYRRWMITRTKALIGICDAERRRHLEGLLAELAKEMNDGK